MAKKPVGICVEPVNVSKGDTDSFVISVSKASKVTEVEPANRQKGHNESPDSGGSIFNGLRLLKFGEFAGKRTWKAVIESGHLALVGTTEKRGNIWNGLSFSGKAYFAKTRDELCRLMTEEFIKAVESGLAPGITLKDNDEYSPRTELSTGLTTSDNFIAGCNERGSIAPRYLATAKECTPIPPFTLDGLAHLAGLLSDKNTASGGSQRPQLIPEEPKRWAMGFLSSFNPKGHCKVKDAEVFLEKFARQVVAGEPEFDPQG